MTYIINYKNILTPVLVIVLSFNIALADTDSLKDEGSTFNFRIVKQIKDFLNIKDSKLENVILESNISSSNAADTYIIASSTYTATSTSNSTTTDHSVATTTLSATSSTTTKITCESQTKLNQKKDKISRKIIAQIQDKNKLVENLLQVSSSSDDKLRPLIDNKILLLESLVSDVIDDQKSLIIELASSTDNVCDSKLRKELLNTKDSKQNILRIKKLELDISKKSAEINNYIKVDIRNILESVIE